MKLFHLKKGLFQELYFRLSDLEVNFTDLCKQRQKTLKKISLSRGVDGPESVQENENFVTRF